MHGCNVHCALVVNSMLVLPKRNLYPHIIFLLIVLLQLVCRIIDAVYSERIHRDAATTQGVLLVCGSIFPSYTSVTDTFHTLPISGSIRLWLEHLQHNGSFHLRSS